MKILHKAVTVIAQLLRISQIAGCFDRTSRAVRFTSASTRGLRHMAAFMLHIFMPFFMPAVKVCGFCVVIDAKQNREQKTPEVFSQE